MTYVTCSALKPSAVDINQQNLKNCPYPFKFSGKLAGTIRGRKGKNPPEFTAVANSLFFMDTPTAIVSIQSLITFSVFSYRTSWCNYNTWRLQKQCIAILEAIAQIFKQWHEKSRERVKPCVLLKIKLQTLRYYVSLVILCISLIWTYSGFTSMPHLFSCW